MSRNKKVWTLGVAFCLLITIRATGQISKPGGAQATEAPQGVMADSPGTGSAMATSPQAMVPRLIKFSGVVHDVTGKPLSGTVDMTFTLYSTEAGGNPLWFETQSVQADESGRYTILLGAMHANGIPIELFTSGEVRWLGIQVGLESEQQPRVLLVSVPYALKAGDAETLGGKPASAFVLAESQNGKTTNTINTSNLGVTQAGPTESTQNTRTASTAPLAPCAAVTSGGSAVVDSIAMFTSACNVESSVISQSSGNVGIGTATPGTTLDVRGMTSADSDARFNILSFDTSPAAAGTGGGVGFGGYFNGTSQVAAFASIRGVKENGTQGDVASALIFDNRASGGNQTERMRITSAGKVGIGTQSPATALDVRGRNISDADASFNVITFDNTPAAAGTGGGIAFGGFYSGASLAAAFANIRGVKENGTQGDYASSLIFDTRASGGSESERMRIRSNGYVGIGTSAPSTMLEVAGAVTARGGTFTGNSIAGTQVINVIQTGNGTGLNIVKNGTSGTGAAVFAPAGGTGVLAQGGTGLYASSNSPTGTAIQARASSATAVAGSFQNTDGGNILTGFGGGTSPVFRLDGTGKGFFDGGTQTGGADFAESVAVLGKHSLYEPGDLLVIDSTGHRRLALADKPYSTMVAGIYSTKPGVLATPHIMDDSKLKEEVPLAIVGIVPCKVTAQNGAIQVGDLLVSSSLPGYAMKGRNRNRMLGAVVGKALEPLDKGKGVIQVLVTLQ